MSRYHQRWSTPIWISASVSSNFCIILYGEDRGESQFFFSDNFYRQYQENRPHATKLVKHKMNMQTLLKEQHDEMKCNERDKQKHYQHNCSIRQIETCKEFVKNDNKIEGIFHASRGKVLG